MISVHVQYRDMTEADCKSWQFYYEEELTDHEVLDIVWAQWNAGSGQESQDFKKANCRSMMVGDYVCINGTWHEVLKYGWRINVPWEEVFFVKEKKDFSKITNSVIEKALMEQLNSSEFKKNLKKQNDEISFAE